MESADDQRCEDEAVVIVMEIWLMGLQSGWGEMPKKLNSDICRAAGIAD